MNAKRKMLLVTVALIMVLSSAGTVFGAGDDSTAYVQQIINYYRSYQDRAATDIARVSEELAQVDAAQAAAWENIMDCWKWANSQMDIRSDVLPDGLSDDDSLCIVVLGYQLMSNGSMQSELVGRLKVALAAAEQYPDAYILCTGGGTAKNNSSATEAGQMAAWLIRNGIDESRIIIENKSLSTVQNAQNSIEILRSDYPSVVDLALITSDYHLRRGCMCFFTQSVLSAYQDGGTLYEIVGTAGYQTSLNSESVSSQASDIAQIAGISLGNQPQPVLSRLSYIAVEGQTAYEPGGQLALTVTAVYDTGYRKVVTSAADFSGFDLSRTGSQIVTVTYVENGYQATAAFKITVAAPGAEAGVPQSTEEVEITGIAETVEPTEETEAAAASASTAVPSPVVPLLVLAATLALLTFALRKLKPKR